MTLEARFYRHADGTISVTYWGTDSKRNGEPLDRHAPEPGDVVLCGVELLEEITAEFNRTVGRELK